MYDMKGLQAGTVFHDAAIKCRTYLKWTTVPETASTNVSGMEKSIFWSCLKTECEIMSQVDIPLSNISELDYLGNFPSPPDPTAANAQPEDRSIVKQEEEGWYFYLGEVAMRWVENRIFHGMYSTSPSLLFM